MAVALYKTENDNSITDDEKIGQRSETEWSSSHQEVIAYAGLVWGKGIGRTESNVRLAMPLL
jgi:hypothetical protein